METKRNKIHLYLVLCIFFALFLKLVIGATSYGTLDLMNYNIHWATAQIDNIFTMYRDIPSMNYPPIFPVLLRLIAPVYSSNTESWKPLVYFGLKFWPIMFDVSISLLLYSLCKDKGKGLVLAMLWSLNPAIFINTSIWGQVDSLLLFLLLVCFYFMENERYGLSTILFAIGCLAKLQFCYFAPIFLVFLFRKSGKKALKKLLIGMGVGILGWLPFMVGSKDLFLAIKIYTSGFGQYHWINMNAFNIYGLMKNQKLTTDSKVFGLISLSSINLVLIMLIMIIFSCLAYKYYSRKYAAYIIPGMYIFTIFMLSMGQHERYQLPVLAFILLLLLTSDYWVIYLVYVFASVLTFFNQFLLFYVGYQWEWFNGLIYRKMPLFSFLNLVFYIVCLILMVVFFIEPRSEDKITGEQTSGILNNLQ